MAVRLRPSSFFRLVKFLLKIYASPSSYLVSWVWTWVSVWAAHQIMIFILVAITVTCSWRCIQYIKMETYDMPFSPASAVLSIPESKEKVKKVKENYAYRLDSSQNKFLLIYSLTGAHKWLWSQNREKASVTWWLNPCNNGTNETSEYLLSCHGPTTLWAKAAFLIWLVINKILANVQLVYVSPY